MTKPSDQHIIASIKEGRTELFSVIIKRYEAQIARAIIGLLGHTQEADDVGQETFIRFYNSIDKYRGEASLGTYLTRIAINLSLNALKKEKRRNLFRSNKDDSQSDILANIPNYDDEHESKDSKELIQHALSLLDVKFRSVIVLRMIEEYSTKETAEILKLPLGTVLSRLTRAQEKLKEQLKKLGYETT